LLVFGAHVPGALREVVAVDPAAAFAADALTPETAALAEPVSIAVHAVGRGGIAAGESTLVLGAGPIGLAVLVAARDRGANVVVADRSARRLQLAAALGADLVVSTTETDLVSAVMEHTGREGMEVVVDASGAPELVRSGFEAAAHSGRVVLVGISLRDLAVPLNEYVRKELTVVGSRNNCGEFASAIDLVARNQERLATLVSHRFPLADAGAALRLASEGSDSAGKILIEVA
jgi:L-gulonate 5-dehydrogenase